MSGRSITGAIQSALAADNLSACMFVQLSFDSGVIYVTTLAHDFDWNGHTWKGLGNLGNVEAIQEGESIEAYGVALTLSGINPAFMSILLSEQYQGRDVRIWFAPLDAAVQIVADPVLIFKGRMDVPAIEVGATATIKVNCEGRLADLDRPRTRRYNHEDQIAVYPADRGLEYVPQMVEKQLFWGIATPAGVQA